MNFYSRLILHPICGGNDLKAELKSKNVRAEFVNINEVRQELTHLKLVTDKENNVWRNKNDEYYLAGEKFTSLIMFMGCAPKINFLPDEDNTAGSNFVAIKFSKLYDEARLYPGKVPLLSRCTICKSNFEVELHSNHLSCTSCDMSKKSNNNNWRHKAGFSFFFIEIMGIYDSEAIPSDTLLNKLNKLTGLKWNYFYADESSLKFLQE